MAERFLAKEGLKEGFILFYDPEAQSLFMLDSNDKRSLEHGNRIFLQPRDNKLWIGKLDDRGLFAIAILLAESHKMKVEAYAGQKRGYIFKKK
ncbi:MAG: hypothetical protein PHC97_01005 [Patescibacteria group bacterium]|nr:hypothetical protein [Patescibacteria group bacterium]